MWQLIKALSKWIVNKCKTLCTYLLACPLSRQSHGPTCRQTSAGSPVKPTGHRRACEPPAVVVVPRRWRGEGAGGGAHLTSFFKSSASSSPHGSRSGGVKTWDGGKSSRLPAPLQHIWFIHAGLQACQAAAAPFSILWITFLKKKYELHSSLRKAVNNQFNVGLTSTRTNIQDNLKSKSWLPFVILLVFNNTNDCFYYSKGEIWFI